MAWCGRYGLIMCPSESFRCDGFESDIHLIRIPWITYCLMNMWFLIKNSKDRNRWFVRKWSRLHLLEMIIPPFDASRHVEFDGTIEKSPVCWNRSISLIFLSRKIKIWSYQAPLRWSLVLGWRLVLGGCLGGAGRLGPEDRTNSQNSCITQASF